MDDLISRQALMKEFADFVRRSNNSDFAPTPTWNDAVSLVGSMPSAQPDDWMERNKERILQAGMEGREIEFRIGGRLFAIREKAQ